MTEHTMAIDCDLRRVHAWCDQCGEVSKAHPNLGKILQHCDKHSGTVLFEISSPVGYGHIESRAAAHVWTRWALWNISTGTFLDSVLRIGGKYELLVSPSNLWTHGYTLKVRHAAAQASASTKDVRECQTMLWMHQHQPTDWIPLAQYLENL